MAYEYPPHLSLDRYQELMDLPIAAFNGINWPAEQPKYECNKIWQPSQRAELRRYLTQAEERRENILGYHLSPKYIEDEYHNYGDVINLNWKHLIEVGKLASSVVEESVALTLGSGSAPNDPVEFTVTTTVTDSDELYVFHEDTETPITPSSISISGDQATIKIPRSRLLKPSLTVSDREDPLMYDNNDNFVTAVDVVRLYTDPSEGAVLVWTPYELSALGVTTYPDGVEQTQAAVPYIHGYRARRLSKISATPGTYADGSWTGKRYTYQCGPGMIKVSYLSGIQNSMTSDMMTIRLAHTFMPNAPVSCPYVEQVWKADREEAQWSPYGKMAGAMESWLHDSMHRIGHGGQLR